MKNSFCILLAILLAGFLPSFAQKQESLPANELTALAKEFVDLLAKEDFSKAVENFDSVMTKEMPEEKLKEVWRSIKGKVGSFKKQIRVRTETLPKFEIVFVTCEFEKATFDIKVVFNKKKQIAGLWFVPTQSKVEYKPPAYANSDSFQEKDVVVGSGEWAMPGTLSLPSGEGPFPALVLVHGSGPQDRDESIGLNKPFRDLAWGLASQNIAVLRYEKRTKAHSQKLKNFKGSFTVKEETIDDALSAVKLLRKTARVDTQKIFVLGHSLGGMVIPRIGQQDSEISGFIIMAGTTRAVEDVIIEQVNYISLLDGKISEREKTKLDEIKIVIEKIKKLKPSDSITNRENLLGAYAEYWLDLRNYDPPEAAKNIQQPMLILQGGRDYQVTIEDFKGWKKALSLRKDVEFKLYPKLNHLFIEGEGKSTPTDYSKSGHVAKNVIDDIADWIKSRK